MPISCPEVPHMYFLIRLLNNAGTFRLPARIFLLSPDNDGDIQVVEHDGTLPSVEETIEVELRHAEQLRRAGYETASPPSNRNS